TGTAGAGATVRIRDAGSQIGTATANASGIWSFVHTYTEGSHSLVAVVNGGNGGTSSTLTLVVDTTAPAAPTISGISPDNGSSGSDGITNSGTLTVSGSAEANATIVVKDGATVLGTVTANGSGAWTLGTTLASGSHPLTATATD